MFGGMFMKVGSLNLHLISDGAIKVDGGAIFGQIPKIKWQDLMRPDRHNRIRLGLNCLLIQSDQSNILVNTGIGGKNGDHSKEIYGTNTSRLVRNLRELGIGPKNISHVVLSDLRRKHAGGSTKLNRRGEAVPTFPKAKYLIQQTAWNEALNPDERDRDSYEPNDFLPLEKAGKVNFLSGDHEVIPGVWVRVSDGPAIGHQIALVTHSGRRVAFLGDVIPTPYHLALPFISAIDKFPHESLKFKKEILAMLEKERWLILFSQGYENRAGYLNRRAGHLSLKPEKI